jgi:UDP:flavonoid glycosyltransferase YjiC (YdhE family)
VPLLKCFEEIFTGVLTLIPSFPEFDPIDNIKQYNTHYLGPVLFDPIEDAKKEDKILFDRRDSKPTIFCYTARFHDNVGESGIKIFKAITHALRCFDANVIISTGSASDKKIALEILNESNYKSEQFNLIDWVPMGIAYGRSDIVIHHGGHGSCLGQFLYGVPSLIMPTHAEREYNARMCTHLKVAEFIRTVDFHDDIILSKIEKLLTADHYKNNLMMWNKMIKDGYGNLNEVVKLIAKI